MNSFQYVAFLRGINVGGHTLIKMDRLKSVFEGIGLYNVRPVLASGNVIFSSSKSEKQILSQMIRDALEKIIDRHVEIFVYSGSEITSLSRSDPFHSIPLTSSSRFYVTFLSDTLKSKLSLPYVSPNKDFTLLRLEKTMLFSVLTLSDRMRTTDSMNIIEKEFGKSVTTRNWNTVLKIGKFLTL